jgi:TP901 family phage tail tape measure protein
VEVSVAERRVKVRFEAEVQGFKRAMEEAAQATTKAKKASEDAGKASDKASEEIKKQALAHHEAAKAVGLQYDNTGQLVTMNGKAVSSQQAAAHGLQTFSKEAYLAGRAAVEAGEASEAAAKVAAEAERMAAEAARDRAAAAEQVGSALMAAGAATVAGLGLASKAAMDWESAWAGVTKTVDGSPEQMAALEGELRNLAKTLPATHEEIAGVAEAAGQLGVKRDDVAGFTRTMVDLGETTNLSADEAATAIAQISNVMGTMEREGSKGVERFGATLVALGNAGASTEAEIVSMAKRIAGAGKLVGASESDVLALANAMASVGIEADLGGGVISRVMQRMYGDVMEGGEGLENLAKVAGVSSKEFATAFESDPVRAVDSVVKGLSRVKAEGGDVISTMTDLGIKGTEETGVILRLAGAGELLADSLALGDSAWKSNSALAEEAAKRYETTESKVKIAWNNIKDAAIDAGAVLLPVIAGAAEGAAGLAQAFGAIPEPVKGALTVLGGVAGVAALGAGAFLTLTPKILDSMQAFDKLAPAGGRARGALAGVGKAAGIATTALIGFEAIKGLHNSMQAPTASLEKFTQALVGIDKEKGALDSLFADIGAKEFEGEINSAGEALNKLINQDFNSAIESFGASIGVDNGMAKLADGLTKADQAIASAVSSGNMDLAAKGFKSIAESADAKGVSLEKVSERFPEYLDSLRKMATESGVALTEQELLDFAMGKVPAKMEAAAKATDGAATSFEGAGDAAAEAVPLTEEMAEALEEVGVSADGTVTNLVKFTDALINAGLLQLSARDAARGFEEALDAMDESLATNGRTLDTSTDKGRANEAALDAIAGAGYRVMQANAANSASQEVLAGNLDTTFNKLVTAARAFTDTDEEAQALARDIMKIPPGVDIKSWMSDEAKRMAEQTTGAINNIPKETVVNVRVNTYETTLHKVLNLPSEDADGSYGKGLGVLERATGGRLPAFSKGGKLPSTGPGTEVTDGFLGVDASGIPRARLDAREWIINGDSSDRYNRELAAINAGTFPKLPGYANGGREYSAQSFGYAPAAAVSVAAPSVTVLIGNEQLDSRMYRVAEGVVSEADSASARLRRGR